MSQLIKKENISIVIGTYEKEGQQKKKHRTIGELITMQGDDGTTYQFGKLWGASGVTEIKVYPQEERSQQQTQQPQQQYAQQQPQMNQQQPDPRNWQKINHGG